jgi:DNA-binding NarL/FixJ family response regulator
MRGQEFEKLTKREGDVLSQLVQGKTNREIAETLVIEESTVETHLDRIYRKLRVSNRTAAVIKAINAGVVML